MLNAQGIRDWVRRANAGDIAVYARGETLSRGVATAAYEMATQGLVDLTRRREGRGWQYLIQRRTKPFALTADRRRGRVFAPASAETIILRMIRDAIRAGRPCPTNAEFAFCANLSGGVAASYRLRKLVREGKIELVDHGPFERRTAILTESGRSTVRAPL